MDYLGIFTASADLSFQRRCIVATWVASQNIIAEDPNTADHANRLAWARKVMSRTTVIAPDVLAQQVLRNSTIAADPAAAQDGDIQFQVNSIIADLVAFG